MSTLFELQFTPPGVAISDLQSAPPNVPLIPFAASPNTTLEPFTFEPLPLGSIKPLGWINDQLSLMSDGLAGHQYDFYHIVQGSPWLGGTEEYSVLNEGLPYWFNGLVPLAYGLNDTRLQSQVQDAVSYIIENQQSDGWIGPEPVGDRDLWARFPLFLGLMQLVQADPDSATTVIPAMYTFIELMNAMLVNNTGFDQIWGQVRYPDMLISLQWLYENHPQNYSQLLLDTMSYLDQRGLSWPGYWTEESFIFQDLDNIQPPIIANSSQFPFTHGVNAAQGLKAGAAVYRFTANESLLQNNRNGVNWTFTYHGDPAGSVIGDERESNVAANRGSELCTAVETMYSMTYLYQTLGDNFFADQCELAAFNALPVSITSDHWGRQYLAVASEPFAHELTDPVPFWNVGGYGIVYGLEPNYPCCTVNMPQGLPKYLSNAFVQVGGNGIGHALLGPAEVSTTTLAGTSVTITCDTNYPFSQVLQYNVTSSAAFNLSLRVPSWHVIENSSLSINGDSAISPNPDTNTGMTSFSLPAGTSTVAYTIGATMRIIPRANSTVAIYHGSLLYALDVGQMIADSPPTLYNTTYNSTINSGDPYNNTPPALPSQVHDFTYTNSGPWNMAIDTSTLTFHTTANASNEAALANPIFDYEAPPTYITGKACQIAWPLYNGLPAPLPALPAGTVYRNCTGNVTDVILRPYGSLKIHMAELPVVNLSGNSTVSSKLK